MTPCRFVTPCSCVRAGAQACVCAHIHGAQKAATQTLSNSIFYSHHAAARAQERKHVGEELSDCLLYLIRLADVCGVDLGAAATSKIQASRLLTYIYGIHYIH